MDGLIVLEPYATMIIEGQKSWELRSRRPSSSRLGKGIYLLSSGEILGVIRIKSYTGPLSKAELLTHLRKHRVKDPEPKLYAWRVEVVRKYPKRKKYIHSRGARVWVKSVRHEPRRAELRSFQSSQ
jgi:ASCH domain